MNVSHYCGDYTALTTTRFGRKIYVDTRDTSLAPHILVDGDWEPWVTNAIGSTINRNRGCLFIDVGANVGWYTLLAADVGASHVYAFEPNPRMVELLRKTVAVNGYQDRVTLTAAACGAIGGQTTLRVDINEMGGAHIASPDVLPAEGHLPPFVLRRDGEVLINVVRLDDVVKVRHVAPLIMKIDVEGYEPAVLAGAPLLLEHRPIILFLEHAQDDLHRLQYAALMDRGFVLQEVRHSAHFSGPMTLDEVMAVGAAETIACSLEGL